MASAYPPMLDLAECMEVAGHSDVSGFGSGRSFRRRWIWPLAAFTHLFARRRERSFRFQGVVHHKWQSSVERLPIGGGSATKSFSLFGHHLCSWTT
jgi:hypothetical protein